MSKQKIEKIFEIDSQVQVVELACGGMHTMALANNGVVFTWGCQDNGALGRLGKENVPLRVDGCLNIPVNGIAAGDTHSVVWNNELNQIFYWGSYKVSDLL